MGEEKERVSLSGLTYLQGAQDGQSANSDPGSRRGET